MRTVFLRAIEAEDKAAALLEGIREPALARGKTRFEVDPKSFIGVPRAPFSYWVSDGIRRLFAKFPRFEAEGRTARLGASTKNDFRFLRLSWELPPQLLMKTADLSEWRPYAKGGAYSTYYADIYLVVRWGDGAREIEASLLHKYKFLDGNADMHLLRKNPYGSPGLTWPPTALGYTRLGMGMAALPAGCVFSSKGCAVFDASESPQRLCLFLAILSSRAVDILMRAMTHSRSWEVGHVQALPFIQQDSTELAALARRAWSLKRSVDTRTEASHAFSLPALLQVNGDTLGSRASAWAGRVRSVETELAVVQTNIDELCFALYGIDEANRAGVTESIGTQSSEEASGDGTNDGDDENGDDTENDECAADAKGLAAGLVSWVVGVAIGRFDIRLATGERPSPIEPQPFDPLPTCSPGMLTGGDGLPLVRAPAGYPLAFPEAGVLVDDLGHAQDLSTKVRAVFDLVFGPDTDRWWKDVAALLDPKGHDLRVWLAGSFFEHHLKRHSKSRRKAPIFWQLGTPSGRNSVWLYAHRLTRDSFFQLQNEVVGPKLAHEERQLTSLIQNAGGSPSAPERKEIAAQEAVVEELRAMLDEIKRIAPLWNPNLDDGVVLTMAPLWRLVPQHRPWQKELKSKWDELAAGKYDWAHIAMHLWPERVVPKCATDRSLAIAHGLEEVLWVKGSDGKWTARATPVKPLDEIVGERASPAVKAALKSLLEAPTGRASKPSSRSRGYR